MALHVTETRRRRVETISIGADGSNYVEVSHNSMLNVGTEDFYITAWIKTTQMSFGTIANKGSETQGYTFYINGGKLGFRLATNRDIYYNSDNSIADDEWHLVTVTVDRDNPEGGLIYVDSNLVKVFDPTEHAVSLDNSEPLRIASSPIDGVGLFQGLIDEVAIFNTVLAQEDIGVAYQLDSSNGFCIEAEVPTEPTLSVKPSFENVPDSSGNVTFNIANAGNGTMDWTATSDSWLTINSATGTNDGTITVNYTANSGDARTGTITVTADGAENSPQTVTVKQVAGDMSCPNQTCNVSTSGSDTNDGSEAKPFATIQHGIDVAKDDYTVLVHPGTYIENLNFNGKNITVKSVSGNPEDTIIDGSQSGTVVTAKNGETAKAVLEGFTITKGSASGIYLGGFSTPTLKNLIVENNQATSGGGIVITSNTVWNRGSQLTTLENVVIRNNTATKSGGGLYNYLAAFDYKGGEISGNKAPEGAGAYLIYGSGYYGGRNKFTDVTFKDNVATGNGGGLYVHSSHNPDHLYVDLSEIAITGNTAKEGSGIYCNGDANGHTYVKGFDENAVTDNPVTGGEWQVYSSNKNKCHGLVDIPAPSSITFDKNFCITGKSSGHGYSWKLITKDNETIGPIDSSGVSVNEESQSLGKDFAKAIYEELEQLPSYNKYGCFAFDGVIKELWVGQYGQNPDCEVTTTGCSYNPIIRIVRSSQGNILSVTPISHSIAETSGVMTLNIENTVSDEGIMGWVAESNSSWLTIDSGDYGENDGIVTIQYDANTGEERVGTITITAPDADNNPQIVEVIQEAGQGVLYTVFGTILDSLGNSIAGATVKVGDKTTITDASGLWTIVDLATGSYTVTAEKEGHNFRSQSVALAGDNFNIEVSIEINPSECAHAEYLVEEKVVRIPFLDIPLLDPLTQSQTGEVAIARVDLSLIEGADDFKILPDTLEVTDVASESSECHAIYSYDGILYLPNVDVQTVIILPPGIVVDIVTRTYEAILYQLPLSPDVFHLESYLLK